MFLPPVFYAAAIGWIRPRGAPPQPFRSWLDMVLAIAGMLAILVWSCLVSAWASRCDVTVTETATGLEFAFADAGIAREFADANGVAPVE